MKTRSLSPRLSRTHRHGTRSTGPSRLVKHTGQPCGLAKREAFLEGLEQRQMLALLGVTLTELPIEFFNSSGVTNYDAATGSFDVAATPTAFLFPSGPRPIIATHGDFQIHLRLNTSGGLVGGVNAGDAVTLGDNAFGYDLVVRGATDVNGDGSIDFGTESGLLLSGEVYAFGSLDSGGPTDLYDFKFIVTGGLMASFYTNRDIGVTMNSDNSTFTGDFSTNFGGKAKGNVGPILPAARSSIAGNVYYDKNNNGLFEGTDQGIEGATVRLTGVDVFGNNIDRTTFTLADGSYYFGGLQAGTYQLTETQPAGYLDGKDTIGTPGGSTSNDQFSTIILPANFDGVQNNFGEIKESSIAGFVYWDKDNDGLFENTDAPIEGALVTLKGTDDLGNNVNLSMNTLADGSYKFTGLRPGDYVLVETQPAGYLDGKDTIGTPGGTTGNDTFTSISLPVDFNGVNNNFGEIKESSIAGFVYWDKDNDGLFENTDAPIEGATVTLTGVDDLGNVINLSMNTLADGSYKFTGLRPGTYQLVETQPSGYLDGKDTIGTPGGTTSNDQFSNINLPTAFDGVNNNFGEIKSGSISGKKFLDVSGNGLTSDDTGLGGVTVYLDLNNNGSKDSGEPSRVTASDGSYLFDSLTPGIYRVREILPAGFIRTAPTLQDYYEINLAGGNAATGLNFANAEVNCRCAMGSYSFLINGTKWVSDLRGNTNAGDEVTVVFTVNQGWEERFTLVSYTAPGPTFVAADAYLQRIYDIDTGVFGPGTHSLTVTIPDCNYQIDFVCGEAIDVFGPAGSNIFYTPQGRLFSADNDGNAACVTGASEIKGSVYVDKDNDGNRDSNETGIAGVKVTLTGTTTTGQNVTIVKYTKRDGNYAFGNLKAGTYKVTQSQPSNYVDGKDTLGSLGGSKPSNDVLASIVLPANTKATGYNFGERVCSGTTLSTKDCGDVGFWRTTFGQNLIKSVNGGSSKTNLGSWLASNFSNLFGSGAGSSNNMSGKTNAQVASFFASKFDNSATALEAQVLATALAAYVTSSNLAGGSYGASYGFNVTSGGIGSGRSVNTSSTGSDLGLSDDSVTTVIDALKRTSNRSSGGVVWSGNSASRLSVQMFFDSLNQIGDIR